MAEIIRCENCGRAIRRVGGPGRRPKWCSRGCRKRAYERRKLDRARAEGREQALAEQPRRKLLA